MQSIKNFLNKLTVEQIWLFFVLVAIVTISIGAALIFSRNQSETAPPVATEEEEQEILTEIIKNNPKAVITDDSTAKKSHLNSGPSKNSSSTSKSTSSASNNSDSEENQPTLEDLINESPEEQPPIPTPFVSESGEIEPLQPGDVVAPDIKVYNYRYTKVVSAKGPAIDRCAYQQHTLGYYNGLNTMDWPSVTEVYYEYFDAERSFYKSVEQDGDGDIYNYYLGRYGKNIHEYYHYAGGEFAARNMFKPDPNFDNGASLEPSSYTDSVSVPTSYNDAAQEEVELETYSYFGYNPVVLNIYQDGDETFILISADVYISCDENNTSVPAIRRYLVRQSDYQIVEQSTYLYEVADQNLVTSRNIQAERRKVNFDQISNEFTFGAESYTADTEVVDIDYQNYEFNAENRANQIAGYLQEQQLPVTSMWDQRFDWEYFTGRLLPEVVPNENYRYNRSFYAAEDKGQVRYDSLQQMLLDSPVITFFFASENLPGWYQPEFVTVDLYKEKPITAVRTEAKSSQYGTLVHEKLIDDYKLILSHPSGEIDSAASVRADWYVHDYNYYPTSYSRPVSYGFEVDPVYPSYPAPTSYADDGAPASYAESSPASPNVYPYLDTVNRGRYEETLVYNLVLDDGASFPIRISHSGKIAILPSTYFHHLTLHGEAQTGVFDRVKIDLQMMFENNYYGDEYYE